MEKWGKERKKELNNNQEQRRLAAAQGALLPLGQSWGFLNSSLEEFGWSFKDVLPKPELSLKDYIEQSFAEKKGNVVGLEYGGHGTKLFSGFSKGFLKKTAGVTISDYRTSSRLSLNALLGRHSVLVGDILEPKTEESVQSWLQGDKVDIIFERMLGGHSFVPFDVFSIAEILRQWYRKLSEDGMMFIELPAAAQGEVIWRWADMVREKYGSVLEVQNTANHLRLKKLPGAPEELPFFSVREMFLILREARKWRLPT